MAKNSNAALRDDLREASAEEVEALQDALAKEQETSRWYKAKMRELLVSHYAHKKDSEIARRLEKELEVTTGDRDRLVGEIERLRLYSPDNLPSVFALPLKAIMAVICSGPFGIVRYFKKKSQSKPEREQ